MWFFSLMANFWTSLFFFYPDFSKVTCSFGTDFIDNAKEAKSIGLHKIRSESHIFCFNEKLTSTIWMKLVSNYFFSDLFPQNLCSVRKKVVKITTVKNTRVTFAPRSNIGAFKQPVIHFRSISLSLIELQWECFQTCHKILVFLHFEFVFYLL